MPRTFLFKKGSNGQESKDSENAAGTADDSDDDPNSLHIDISTFDGLGASSGTVMPAAMTLFGQPTTGTNEHGSTTSLQEPDKQPPVIEKYKETPDGYKEKVFECIYCAKEFKKRYLLMRHFPTHTGERRYVCSVCHEGFSRASTLSRHKAIHKADHAFQCPVCHKRFNRSSSLKAHCKTHEKQKSHTCPYCGKGFHQKGNLKTHVFTHTGYKPYICEHCHMGFNQASNLSVHVTRMHKDRQEHQLLTCSLCDETFLKRKLLRRHELEAHYRTIIGKLETNSSKTSKALKSEESNNAGEGKALNKITASVSSKEDFNPILSSFERMDELDNLEMEFMIVKNTEVLRKRSQEAETARKSPKMPVSKSKLSTPASQNKSPKKKSNTDEKFIGTKAAFDESSAVSTLDTSLFELWDDGIEPMMEVAKYKDNVTAEMMHNSKSTPCTSDAGSSKLKPKRVNRKNKSKTTECLPEKSIPCEQKAVSKTSSRCKKSSKKRTSQTLVNKIGSIEGETQIRLTMGKNGKMLGRLKDDHGNDVLVNISLVETSEVFEESSQATDKDSRCARVTCAPDEIHPKSSISKSPNGRENTMSKSVSNTFCKSPIVIEPFTSAITTTDNEGKTTVEKESKGKKSELTDMSHAVGSEQNSPKPWAPEIVYGWDIDSNSPENNLIHHGDDATDGLLLLAEQSEHSLPILEVTGNTESSRSNNLSMNRGPLANELENQQFLHNPYEDSAQQIQVVSQYEGPSTFQSTPPIDAVPVLASSSTKDSFLTEKVICTESELSEDLNCNTAVSSTNIEFSTLLADTLIASGISANTTSSSKSSGSEPTFVLSSQEMPLTSGQDTQKSKHNIFLSSIGSNGKKPSSRPRPLSLTNTATKKTASRSDNGILHTNSQPCNELAPEVSSKADLPPVSPASTHITSQLKSTDSVSVANDPTATTSQTTGNYELFILGANHSVPTMNLDTIDTSALSKVVSSFQNCGEADASIKEPNSTQQIVNNALHCGQSAVEQISTAHHDFTRELVQMKVPTPNNASMAMKQSNQCKSKVNKKSKVTLQNKYVPIQPRGTPPPVRPAKPYNAQRIPKSNFGLQGSQKKKGQFRVMTMYTPGESPKQYLLSREVPNVNARNASSDSGSCCKCPPRQTGSQANYTQALPAQPKPLTMVKKQIPTIGQVYGESREVYKESLGQTIGTPIHEQLNVPESSQSVPLVMHAQHFQAGTEISKTNNDGLNVNRNPYVLQGENNFQNSPSSGNFLGTPQQLLPVLPLKPSNNVVGLDQRGLVLLNTPTSFNNQSIERNKGLTSDCQYANYGTTQIQSYGGAACVPPSLPSSLPNTNQDVSYASLLSQIGQLQKSSEDDSETFQTKQVQDQTAGGQQLGFSGNLPTSVHCVKPTQESCTLAKPLLQNNGASADGVTCAPTTTSTHNVQYPVKSSSTQPQNLIMILNPNLSTTYQTTPQVNNALNSNPARNLTSQLSNNIGQVTPAFVHVPMSSQQVSFQYFNPRPNAMSTSMATLPSTTMTVNALQKPMQCIQNQSNYKSVQSVDSSSHRKREQREMLAESNFVPSVPVNQNHTSNQDFDVGNCISKIPVFNPFTSISDSMSHNNVLGQQTVQVATGGMHAVVKGDTSYRLVTLASGQVVAVPQTDLCLGDTTPGAQAPTPIQFAQSPTGLTSGIQVKANVTPSGLPLQHSALQPTVLQNSGRVAQDGTYQANKQNPSGQITLLLNPSPLLAAESQGSHLIYGKTSSKSMPAVQCSYVTTVPLSSSCSALTSHGAIVNTQQTPHRNTSQLSQSNNAAFAVQGTAAEHINPSKALSASVMLQMLSSKVQNLSG